MKHHTTQRLISLSPTLIEKSNKISYIRCVDDHDATIVRVLSNTQMLKKMFRSIWKNGDHTLHEL